ncbi:MAG: enamine deaminase RidA [Candidatus Nephthysia bennettiae]|uniref:RidA family protein n=1 Tax=Candidatus Nephthysia bennettiae TaxID=3127016 RepID=A0A934K3L0_9BACT|nr:RidA family protein [Candidatus Dormibacteraeota bacterium]MBJ7612113.1 RidA family protein [Candidatus Dormibacteraeota bacterium]PZR86699.1 MAG: enamine deaminase RidA [Candidatus Dormibacteraeota bacterium]
MSDKVVIRSEHLSKPIGVFSQAVRIPAGRELLFISGLTSRNRNGDIHAPNDVGSQTRQILENMVALLSEVGATLEDLVKVTIFVRDIGDVGAINEVRREYFHGDPPASSLVQVAALADQRLRVEIEGIALLPA